MNFILRALFSIIHHLFYIERKWWLFPVLSGVLIGFAFPTYPFIRLELLAWFGLIPILIHISRVESFSAAFRSSYLTTFVMTLCSVWWVSLSTVAGGVLMYFAQSFFSTIPFLIHYQLSKWLPRKINLLLLPLVWTVWEWIYLDLEISFGWITLGNSQANFWQFFQFIDLTGVWGISFWLVLFNVLILLLLETAAFDPNYIRQLSESSVHLSKETASLLRSIIAKVSVIKLLMILPPLLYSLTIFSLPEPESKSLTVAIVQPNLDPFLKWNSGPETLVKKQIDPVIKSFLNSTQSFDKNPELFVFPETAFAFYLLNAGYRPLLESIHQFSTALNAHILCGFADFMMYENDADRQAGAKRDQFQGKYFDSFNSAFLLSPSPNQPLSPYLPRLKSRLLDSLRMNYENPQVYHKMKLVPFAERVPYMDLIPFISDLTFSVAGISSWGRGKEQRNFQFITKSNDTVKVPGLICYESIYPRFVSEFVAQGATMLTVITNDGWFSKSYGPYQHAAFAKLRCIETRRAMARCANTGISFFIDRYGRSYGEIPWWEERITTANVPQYQDISFYVRYPDLLPKISLVLIGLVIIGVGVNRIKSGQTSDPILPS
ncbi:MAG: apolipoprotein N-acyltransferase [Chloroherpetonaceae bacterium]|nr:apolipoprotein N-acyltransferase [Chloroherpetonaceae bacterium]